MVVEGEVVTGDNVDARIFLKFPVLQTQAFSFREELGL